MNDTLSTVPLDSLIHSKTNVRKGKRNPEFIESLAASIEANGLMQNLVVSEQGDKNAVEAGGNRLEALRLLKKRGSIGGDYPVPVKYKAEGLVSASLTENIHRQAMHPVDEFEAFHRLNKREGLTVEDIAVQFGISELHVKQRLRLGDVHNALRAACKAGSLSLGCLKAFTLTSDKGRQLEVWEQIKDRHYNEHIIRRYFVDAKIPSSDFRVQAIGLEAYIEAGGPVEEDLFSGIAYLSDEGLLEKLCSELLDKTAKQYIGWNWVRTDVQCDHSFLNSCTVIEGTDTKETKALRKELATLEKQRDKDSDRYYDDEMNDDDEKAFLALEETIEGFDDKIENSLSYDGETMAVSGVYIYLSQDGVTVRNGLVRPEDRKQAKAKSKANDMEDSTTAVPEFSNALVHDLQLYRQSVCKKALSQSFEVAFDAVVYQLVMSHKSAWEGRLLSLRADSTFTESSRKDIAESEPSQYLDDAIAQVLSVFAKLDEPAEVFRAIQQLSAENKQSIFATLVAPSLCSPTEGMGSGVFGVVEQELNASLRTGWMPTADNCFNRVGRDKALHWAVQFGILGDETTLSKRDIALALETHFSEGHGISGDWVPDFLYEQP